MSTRGGARLPTLALALALAAACLLAAVPAVAVAPLVNASIEPRQIALGESAQLTITSSGSGMEAITLPTVAGLEFRVIGQSRRVEIVNGVTLSTTAVVLRVTPQTAGIFTIPGITPKSQPLVLRVNPENGSGGGNGNGTGSGANGLNGTLRSPLAGGTSANGIHLTADGSAFVRMNLPKRDVYVGESIPVEIEVGMRAGFVTSLNGLPTLTGNDFTLNNLSRKPERVEKLIDGKPFTLLTWHSVLAPVKPGTFTLSVESPLTVRIRTRPARDSMIDDLLGDPFLQNYFGPTVPKDITVASPPAELKVLELPTEGRPRDFSGAVGAFKISSELSAATAAVGDPLTLRLHVTGSGNFDRVDTPMLEHVERWKTYPPKSTFNAGDAIGFKGEKTFEQPLIASQPGSATLPELSFSYFDPATRRYETLHSTPPPVKIAPSLAQSTAAQESATASATVPATTPATAPNPSADAAGRPPAAAPTAAPDGLHPDHPTGAAAGASALAPLYVQTRFLVFPSLFALASAGAWLRLRRRPTGEAPRTRKLRLSKATRALLQRMEGAARTGDAATFLTAARSVLQQTLAARWNIAPEALLAEDTNERLGEDGADVRQLFVLADEANYSGRQLSSVDYERWTHIVRRQLGSAA